LGRGNTIIEEGEWGWDRELMDGKSGKGITFEMKIKIIQYKKNPIIHLIGKYKRNA